MPEQVKFWRASDLGMGDVEFLHARYITHSFARHTHEGFAIGVVERGTETFYYRSGQHYAPTGSMIIINPGEVHTGNAAQREGWTYRMIYPDVELLRRAASELAGRQQDIPFLASPVIEDIALNQLFLNVHRMLEDSTFALQRESGLLNFLTLLVARHARVRPNLPTTHSAGPAIRRVRDYLDDHLIENVSLRELAHIAELSPFHLLRTFRATVGLPPHTYVIQQRVARAKTLLMRGWPPALAAHEVGFTDQSHLTRHFKRITGVTPSQYARA